jgi:hypothetical protein
MAEGVVRGSGDWLGALGPALLLFVLYTLGGCLAALALVFLLISVSLSVRPGLMPTIGAVLQVVMQVALPVVVLALNASSAVIFRPGSDERANFLPMTATYLVLWLLVMFLLLYLARRADWLRRAIGYALPLLLTGIGLVIYGVFTLSGELFEFYGEIFLYGLWAAQFLAITAPLPVDAGALSMVFDAADAAGALSWQVYLLIPAAQLVLLVICAEFARDALSRRKWGKEGE